MSEQLSIITICFNDRAGLESTLASVAEQTSKAFEHIVVDGGSTDGSVELIEQHHADLSAWVSEKDGGIYFAQNKAWKMARTPFVLFLNSGDTLADASVLERALPLLDDEVDILYGDALLTNAEGVYGKKIHPARITSAYLMKETIAHQSQFIRRKVLEQLGGYDTHYRIAADYAFLARAFWEFRPVLRHAGFAISTFDTQGLSSAPEHKRTVAEERKRIQRRYAPALWYRIYHAYAALNSAIGR